jgi:hypothetical protein
MEVDMPESITGFWIGLVQTLDVRQTTSAAEGVARRRRLPTPALLDEEHPGRSFTCSDREELPAVKLPAPAMGRRRQAEKTSSVKKHPSRRSANRSSARRPGASRSAVEKALPFSLLATTAGQRKERAAAPQS